MLWYTINVVELLMTAYITKYVRDFINKVRQITQHFIAILERRYLLNKKSI